MLTADSTAEGIKAQVGHWCHSMAGMTQWQEAELELAQLEDWNL